MKYRKCMPLVVSMFDFGYKAEEIAAVYGKSAATIRDMLRVTGRTYSRRRAKKVSCPAAIVALRLCGMSMQSIADELNLKSCNSVWRVLAENNLSGRAKQTGKYDGAIIEQYGLGIRNASEIARNIGIGPSYVSRRCKDLGLPMPSRKEWNDKVHDAAVFVRGEFKNRGDKRFIRFGTFVDHTVSLDAALDKLGSRCAICGKETSKDDRRWGTLGPDYPTLDHIIPLSKGGSHTWGNIQIACGYCNCVVKSDRLEGVA